MARTHSSDTGNPETKRKRGPPLGSANAVRHGLCSGKLPKGCQYVEHRTNALRRQLEAAVVAVKGSIGIVDAAAINSAIKWEKHGLLAQHWLRHKAAELSNADLLKFSEAIAKASDNRDKAIRLLQLDRDTQHDTLAALYAPQLPAPTGETDDESN